MTTIRIVGRSVDVAFWTRDARGAVPSLAVSVGGLTSRGATPSLAVSVGGHTSPLFSVRPVFTRRLAFVAIVRARCANVHIFTRCGAHVCNQRRYDVRGLDITSRIALDSLRNKYVDIRRAVSIGWLCTKVTGLVVDVINIDDLRSLAGWLAGASKGP